MPQLAGTRPTGGGAATVSSIKERTSINGCKNEKSLKK